MYSRLIGILLPQPLQEETVVCIETYVIQSLCLVGRRYFHIGFIGWMLSGFHPSESTPALHFSDILIVVHQFISAM